jgi:hypothetical protein
MGKGTTAPLDRGRGGGSAPGSLKGTGPAPQLRVHSSTASATSTAHTNTSTTAIVVASCTSAEAAGGGEELLGSHLAVSSNGVASSPSSAGTLTTAPTAAETFVHAPARTVDGGEAPHHHAPRDATHMPIGIVAAPNAGSISTLSATHIAADQIGEVLQDAAKECDERVERTTRHGASNGYFELTAAPYDEGAEGDGAGKEVTTSSDC